MPRRNDASNLDFEIHVDPSCTDMDDNEDSTKLIEEIDALMEECGKSERSEAGLAHVDGHVEQHSSEQQGKTPALGSAIDDDAGEVDKLDTGEPKEVGSLVRTTEDAPEPQSHDEHDVEDQSLIMESIEGDDSILSADEPGNDAESTSNYSEDSRRQSLMSNVTDRRGSRRTEALIHAAARDIVAQIHDGQERESLASVPETDTVTYESHSQPGSTRQSDVSMSVLEDSIIASYQNDDAEHAEDEGGESSSHHENEDDVFSDDSPRSSMGSVSEEDQKKLGEAMDFMTRSPRISNISEYDREEDFLPSAKGTPRPAFRSPSSVRAMQMASPPASVFGSPRSTRRTPMSAVSRLGSPSAQFSPKRTPPRFKRNTPPLVLLHVTLLPLRWQWAEVLENAQSDSLSPEAKAVREAWRQLQDRMGDTVLERGILLPHPQNDYEVLEERLLEALELPLRRRARILECGHYLGPSNEMTLSEDIESENDDADNFEGTSTRESKAQWCKTCRSDIRYESLGAGKLFRVKVYASNGLMKAGAWEACWKEMERVDVELEPLVDAASQEELNRLAAEQETALGVEEETLGVDPAEGSLEDIGEASYIEESTEAHRDIMSSPPAPSPRQSDYDTRQRMNEERLREIYGHSPPQSTTLPPPTQEQPPTDYTQHTSPPSPSVEAFERRQGRRHAYKSASLPELLLEAGRVLMQDRKNVVIVLLAALVMAFAVRGGGDGQMVREPAFQTLVQSAEVQTVTVTEVAVPVETTGVSLSSVIDEETISLDVLPASTNELQVGETMEVPESTKETLLEIADSAFTEPEDLAAIDETVGAEAAGAGDMESWVDERLEL